MTTFGSEFIEHSHVRDAYLGKYALQLMSETSAQMGSVYAARGLDFPIEVSSTLHFLLKNESASLSDVARGLGLQHQLVGQRLKKLFALGFAEKQPDPHDARRHHLVLTEKGRAQAEQLVACMEDTAGVYRALFAEIGCDLTEVFADVLTAIRTKPLHARFEQKNAEEEVG